jgi:hypothetical protein
MSTVRIQLRRGLASEWTAADTALNASGGLKLAGGEVGLETDTGTFKFGDGTTRWSDLPYALENTLGDYVLLEDVGVANGVASLNSSGKVPASQLDISELSQDAVNTALVAGTGISKTYDDNANTITLAVNATTSNISEGTNLYFTDERAQDAVNTALTAGTGILKTYDDNANVITLSVNATTDNITEGTANKYFTDERAQDAVNTAIVAGTNIAKSYDDNANTITISMPNDIALSGYVDANQILGNSGAIDGELTAGSLTVSGNLTVNGTTTTVNSTTLVVDDPIIKIADGNAANSVDIGFAGSRTVSGTYSHTGLVKDATDGTWKLFSGVTTEPGSTVDFTTWTKDDLQVGNMYTNQLYIGNVEVGTEINLLSGATGNIQTQLNNRTTPTDVSSTYAPIVSPTFSGTVTLPGTISIGDVSSAEIGYLNGVTSDIQTQINEKISSTTAASTYAPLNGATFTGGIILPSTTSIGDVSGAEIGYLNNVTSAIQTQLDQKSTDLSDHASDTTSVHGIADTSALATKTYADSAVTTHQSDSTNIHGIADTANLVTLDGTETLTAKRLTSPKINEDVAVTATATELNILDGATLSTTELNYVDGVTSAIQTQMNDKAPLNSPTFTGTVTLPNNTISQSMMGDDSVGTNEIGGLAVTNEKLAGSIGWDKLAISSTISSTELGYVDGVTSSIQTQLDDKLSKTGGTMTGALTLSGAPTSDLHAATKLYVDNVTAGLNFHEAVHAATTVNLATIYSNGTSGVGATLTADTNRAMTTIDGETVVLNERVLVKNQTDAKQNGIYVLTTLGSVSVPWVLTRATDADNNPTGEMKNGDFTFVQRGTVNASIGFINNSATNPIVIGTDNITYTEFNAGKTVVAGDGLTEATPGTISVASGGVTSAMIADGTIVDGDINASAAIAQSKISGLTAALGDKAPLASPTFTGTVTLPAAGIVFSDGTQALEGVPSRTPIIQKTASYTLSSLTERDDLIEMYSASSGITLTIPADSTLNFPIGTSIDILQTGAGQVTIAGTGFTPNATPGLKLRTQWSSCTLFKRAANTWVVMGDLSA